MCWKEQRTGCDFTTAEAGQLASELGCSVTRQHPSNLCAGGSVRAAKGTSHLRRHAARGVSCTGGKDITTSADTCMQGQGPECPAGNPGSFPAAAAPPGLLGHPALMSWGMLQLCLPAWCAESSACLHTQQPMYSAANASAPDNTQSADSSQRMTGSYRTQVLCWGSEEVCQVKP